jgi:hypothetical protein
LLSPTALFPDYVLGDSLGRFVSFLDLNGDDRIFPKGFADDGGNPGPRRLN